MTSHPPDAGTQASGLPECYRHAGRETGIRCQRCGRPICTECMNDAAVGFQCPSCIKEGARSTRQGQAAYGGRRSANPALTSFVLIGLNAAVWLAIVLTGWQDSRLIGRLALSARGICESVGMPGSYYDDVVSERQCSFPDGSWVSGVADGAVWQLVTNMFTQVEIWHIAANMLSLFVLGPQIEAVLGRVRFLAVYVISGLTGSTAVYWLSGTDGYTLGASGAIFGLFGALAVVVHKVGGDLRSIAGLLVVNGIITFVVPNISWQGHVGGLIGGAVVAAIVVYTPRGPRRPLLQGLALGGVVALLVLGVILRSATLA